MSGDTIHIIGIGGIGVSALARLLLWQGKQISGTNDAESPETLDELRAKGVSISLDLDPKKLPTPDYYVYTDAWVVNHPEIMEEARSRNVPMFSYYEALGEIANRSKCMIAVSGTHGKTTTTAMLIDTLEAGGLDPIGVVGSLRAKTRSNFRAGKEDYFISEADEYKRHFLSFSPRILVITNIDADHLDYYKDMAAIQSAFAELAKRVPADGYIVCDPSSDTVKPIIKNLSGKVVDYKKYFDPTLKLNVLSLHQINAAAVLAVADILNINAEVARRALGDFTGTWRRFEYKGKTKNGALVYDDYAHHPEEIKVTLKSVREQFPGKKIVVAFHPHLYSRTRLLFDEFSKAFTDADDVIIAPIFPAREAPDPTVSNTILAESIARQGKDAKAMDFDEIERYLKTQREGSLVITMGAGDIYKVAQSIVETKPTGA